MWAIIFPTTYCLQIRQHKWQIDKIKDKYKVLPKNHFSKLQTSPINKDTHLSTYGHKPNVPLPKKQA